MEEVWKPIAGFEGKYEVSNLGQVRRLPANNMPMKMVPQMTTFDGYAKVGLYKDKRTRGYYVHRLVATAFIPNPNNLPLVNHKDETTLNNVVDNLEWADVMYNNNYGKSRERMSKQSGRRKKIDVFDSDGNLITTYGSVNETAEGLGYSTSWVHRLLRGRSESKEYILKYANAVDGIRNDLAEKKARECFPRYASTFTIGNRKLQWSAYRYGYNQAALDAAAFLEGRAPELVDELKKELGLNARQ